MKTFELIPSNEITHEFEPSGKTGLGSDVLKKNSRWFTSVRWIVIAMFGMGGILSLLGSSSLSRLALFVPSAELLALAGILLLGNILFILWQRRFTEETAIREAKLHMWSQIVLDLLVVTGLVHFIGSVDTFIPFTYLFHIAMACIFFPPRESLIVTLVAASLYLLNVILEITGYLPPAGMLTGILSQTERSSLLDLVQCISAIFIWFVVWYFISTLSEEVRKRDQMLSEANERLKKANHEKNQQMIVTTHDLKAPFAGIESNVSVLKYQYWEEIPESIKEIIERIAARSQTLRERINDILLLGDLRSRALEHIQAPVMDLREVVQDVVEELKEKAEGRQLSWDMSLPSLKIHGERELFAILLLNLISNAINYSKEHGVIVIRGEYLENAVTLSVKDSGIGIREDALPQIFDEYFRTKEAASFNRLSTGLGLAIVKEIALLLDISIKVDSEEGKGTEFSLSIPRV